MCQYSWIREFWRCWCSVAVGTLAASSESLMEGFYMMDSSTHYASAGTQEGERLIRSPSSCLTHFLSLTPLPLSLFSPSFFLQLPFEQLGCSLSLSLFNLSHILSPFTFLSLLVSFLLFSILFVDCSSSDLHLHTFIPLLFLVCVLAYSQCRWMKRSDWSRHYPVISQSLSRGCLWAESQLTWQVACRDPACRLKAASGTFWSTRCMSHIHLHTPIYSFHRWAFLKIFLIFNSAVSFLKAIFQVKLYAPYL